MARSSLNHGRGGVARVDRLISRRRRRRRVAGRADTGARYDAEQAAAAYEAAISWFDQYVAQAWPVDAPGHVTGSGVDVTAVGVARAHLLDRGSRLCDGVVAS